MVSTCLPVVKDLAAAPRVIENLRSLKNIWLSTAAITTKCNNVEHVAQ